MLESSKSRLTPKQIENFTSDSLFDKLARAVCRAGVLPAKELYETWEMARRVRRKYRGGRVVDMAGGHGLLAHAMLLLDDSSPSAIIVDVDRPPNASALSRAIADQWPRLHGRITYRQSRVARFHIEPADLVVSAHACGTLSDTILERTVEAGARLALLPCCQDLKLCDTGGLEGWMDGPLAVDVTRAARLRSAGYTVMTRTIPASITPKNRLLMGHP